ncbi:MAG: DUF4139 domain-containing protein [Gemmatimonadales bacterium]
MSTGRVTALLAACFAAAPLAAQTSLTIYQDGRVLVRRTVTVAVPSGQSTQRLALGLLEPSTLFPLDSGVAITGAAYDAAVDEQNTMRRAVGRQIWFRTGGRTNNVWDTVSATVLGVDPERFRFEDGRIVFQRPGLPLYPPELVLVDPTLVLGLRTAAALPALRLGYFTSGATWTAGYDVVLGRASARVTGSAAILSGTVRVENAEVQLLAGTITRGPRPPMPVMERALAVQRDEVAGGFAKEEGVGEAHLYTVPGRLRLEPGVTTSAALFEPASAPWERSYVVRGEIPFWGPLPNMAGNEGRVPVEVTYTLTRRPGAPFGELPLPGGSYRLYQADEGGRLQLIGEASAGHVAPGQEVRLPAGNAFDLTATRVQTAFSTRRDSLRTYATADYRVTVANAKDSAVVVDVLEERGGEWSVLSSSAPAQKLSSTRTRFRIRVPARGEASVTYRVRVIW